MPSQPDLVTTIGSVSVTPSVETGELTIAFSIENVGDGDLTDDTILRIYLSNDSTITEAEDIVVYQATVSDLVAGDFSPVSVTVPLHPNFQADGTYYVGIVSDVNDTAAESNENNNISVAEFTVLNAPDLTISDLVIDTPIVGNGGNVNGHGTVANLSDIAIGDSFDVQLLLSVDQTFSNADTTIGVATITSLGANGTHTFDWNFDLAPGAIPNGTYYVGMIADSSNQIDETNELNNISSAAFVVNSSLLPDLSAISVTLDNTVIEAGQSVTGTAIVQNIGQLAIGDFFDITVFFSPDNNIDGTGNDVTRSVGTVTALNADKTATLTFDILIAEGELADGTYYVGVIADSGGQITESDESNNVTTSLASFTLTNAEAGQPDLVAINLVADSTTVHEGGTLSGSVQIINQGTAALPESSTASFYISTDQTIDSNDILIEAVIIPALSAGQTLTINYDYNIVEGGFPDGIYYLGVLSDSGQNILESDESNNLSNILTITADTPQPDLTITDFTQNTQSAEAGDTITGTLTITNEGEASLNVAPLVNIYMSATGSVSPSDTFLASVNVGTLEAGASQTVNYSIVIPALDETGTYSFAAFVDIENFIAESDEDNNSSAVLTFESLGPLPDIIVTDLVRYIPDDVNIHDSAVAAGDTVNGSVTFQNLGSVTTGNGFAAILNLTDGSGTIVQTLTLDVDALDVGASQTMNYEFVVPAEAVSGDYSISAVVDSGAVITEEDETNNASSISLEVNNNLADLVATNLVVSNPTAVSPGSLVTGSVTITNSGDRDIHETSDFPIAIYISADSTVTSDDILFETLYITQGLAAGASTTLNYIDTLPENLSLSSGTYYVGVIVDGTNIVSESDETNNTSNSVTVEIKVPINGSDESETLFGTAGDDTINGNGGDDVLIGGAGNDTIDGGDGFDWLYGGAGADTIYGGGGATDVLLGDAGNDTLYGQDGFDYLYGYDDDDTIYGGNGIDVAYGGNGTDILRGEADTDWLFGGNGNDTLYGGDNPDLLIGEQGDDLIIGGVGNDWLWGDAITGVGGGGSDIFSFSTGWGVDVVYDFENGIDLIDLSGSNISNFSELSIGQIQGGFTWIAGDGGVIYLNSAIGQSLTAADLTESDFIF